MIRTLLTLAVASLPATVLAANYDVTVGADSKLAFNPEFVNGQPGDTVTFTFYPKNHTVTQSTFDQPCSIASGGFDTGFKPVPVNQTTDFPQEVFTIHDTTPAWFYCAQKALPAGPAHCPSGMVFAVNPPPEGNEKSFSAFKALAMKSNATSSTTSSATDTWVTPPPQTWHTATATITHDASTWTSTYTSYEGSAQPTFAPQPVVHKITVGLGGLIFNPPNISAAIGDQVVFEFHPKAHGVTQSSFSSPCSPLAGGFESGLKPVASEDADKPIFTLTINDTAPIWGYCPQQGPPVHCGEGMVFSINAVESGPNNFANFQTIANRTKTTAGGAQSGSGSGSGSDDNNKNAAVSSVGLPSATFGLAMISVICALFA
ncbi:hypothetical protein V5O48_006913 [Marasmius crinis-equi]|uniref:Cupredoxin n=1 Tax=Marasmius crinis-equi TaxID=585013 RepID=A0ABR3FI94_9AGAR